MFPSLSAKKTKIFIFFLLASFSIQEAFSQDLNISDPQIMQRLNMLPEGIRSDVLKQISEQDQINNSEQLVTDSLRESARTEGASKDKSEKVFGQDFFSYSPVSPTPFSDLPIKSEIVLSEGDKLELFINGSSGNDGIIPLTIALDGTVLFKEFGKVTLSGLTFEEAEQKLSVFLSQFIIFSDVSLTLTELSVVEVSVVGAVNSPGIYRVNPASSIVGILQYAGGISDFGSFRNVEHRTGSQSTEIDLYDFLISGKQIKSRPVRSGDIIFVKPRNNTIEIDGEVKRPGIYEIFNETTLSEVLALALGSNEVSDIENVYIETSLGGSVVPSENKDLDFKGISRIYVPKLALKFSENIRVYGPLLGRKIFSEFPSNFEDFIKSISFSEEVYPYFSVLLSRNILSDFTYELMPFSLSDQETYKNISLKKTENIVLFFKASDFLSPKPKSFGWSNGLDEVQINLVSQMIDDYSLALIGDFYNENLNFPVFGNIDLPQFITFTGGLRDSAEKDNIQFVDFKNNSSFTVDLQNSSKYFASGISTIFAPSSKKELLAVSITGEVNYPGVYEMLPGDTLQMLYAKAGGLTEEASKRSIIFTRESIKQKEEQAILKSRSDLLDSIINNIANPSISGNIPPINLDLVNLYDLSKNLTPVGRLVGELSPSSNTSKTLKLEDSDYIFVPREPSTVNIIGEVQSPITVSYDIYNDDVLHYINASGGFTEYSDKNAIYIIKSNGTSIPYKRSIFSIDQVVIEPGDTVVVPKKFLQVRGLALLSVASKTLSEIAFTAASLNAIQN